MNQPRPREPRWVRIVYGVSWITAAVLIILDFTLPLGHWSLALVFPIGVLVAINVYRLKNRTFPPAKPALPPQDNAAGGPGAVK